MHAQYLKGVNSFIYAYASGIKVNADLKYNGIDLGGGDILEIRISLVLSIKCNKLPIQSMKSYDDAH